MSVAEEYEPMDWMPSNVTPGGENASRSLDDHHDATRLSRRPRLASADVALPVRRAVAATQPAVGIRKSELPKENLVRDTVQSIEERRPSLASRENSNRNVELGTDKIPSGIVNERKKIYEARPVLDVRSREPDAR
ncbi:hypothetical protein SAMN03159288_04644 [Rhizobium sp. NFACC06-2]|nr:hypothetical protein SAMN03159288_04644 [Rhizobium sp. NFACC06-2]